MNNDTKSMDPLAELRRRNAEAEAGGGAERREREHKTGKLTARERVALLLDEGTFEELDKFVAHRSDDFGMQEQRPPGDGFITGFGRIAGRCSCIPKSSERCATKDRKSTRLNSSHQIISYAVFCLKKKK